MNIYHKEWVCLLDAEALARIRQKALAEKRFDAHRGINEPLWRQISLRMHGDQIFLELGNVNEEASLGGYWSCSYDCRNHKFTWADLDDTQFVKNLVAHEQYIVAERVLQVLEALRVQRLVFRRALSASFDSSATADTALAA